MTPVMILHRYRTSAYLIWISLCLSVFAQEQLAAAVTPRCSGKTEEDHQSLSLVQVVSIVVHRGGKNRESNLPSKVPELPEDAAERRAAAAHKAEERRLAVEKAAKEREAADRIASMNTDDAIAERIENKKASETLEQQQLAAERAAAHRLAIQKAAAEKASQQALSDEAAAEALMHQAPVQQVQYPVEIASTTT